MRAWNEATASCSTRQRSVTLLSCNRRHVVQVAVAVDGPPDGAMLLQVPCRTGNDHHRHNSAPDRLARSKLDHAIALEENADIKASTVSSRSVRRFADDDRSAAHTASNGTQVSESWKVGRGEGVRSGSAQPHIFRR